MADACQEKLSGVDGRFGGNVKTVWVFSRRSGAMLFLFLGLLDDSLPGLGGFGHLLHAEKKGRVKKRNRILAQAFPNNIYCI